MDEDYRKILACTSEAGQGEHGTAISITACAIPDIFVICLVRKAVKTEEILVDLVTTTETDAQAFLDTWVKKLLELELDGKMAGILHTKNDSVADVVKDEGTEVLLMDRIISMKNC